MAWASARINASGASRVVFSGSEAVLGLWARSGVVSELEAGLGAFIPAKWSIAAFKSLNLAFVADSFCFRSAFTYLLFRVDFEEICALSGLMAALGPGLGLYLSGPT